MLLKIQNLQNISPRAVRQSEPCHGRGRSRYRRCHVIHVSRSRGVGEGRASGYPRIAQVAGVWVWVLWILELAANFRRSLHNHGKAHLEPSPGCLLVRSHLTVFALAVMEYAVGISK